MVGLVNTELKEMWKKMLLYDKFWSLILLFELSNCKRRF